MLGQLTGVFRGSGINIYIFDIAVLTFALIGSMYFLAVKRSFIVPFWHFLGFTFILWGFVTLIFSLNTFYTGQFINGFFYIIRFVGYLLSSLVLMNMLRIGKIDHRYLTDLLIVSGLVVSALGFVQLIFLPDFSVLDPALGWDPHKNRLASSFFDPNFTGAYLVIIFAVLLDRIYREFKFTVFNLISFIVIVLSIFLTFSRSAWGMLSLVVLVFGVLKYRKLLLLFLILAFSTYFAIPRVQTRIAGVTDPADSAGFRLMSWSNTLKVVKDNWVIGVGYNTYRYAQEEYGFLTSQNLFNNSGAGSDSSLLFVLATTGVVGLIMYGFFFIYPVVYSYLKKQDSFVFIAAVTLGLFVESLFINSLFFPQIMFLWFSLVVSYLFYIEH
jgi:putative inorganic carbon (HCO3(-)) transporter